METEIKNTLETKMVENATDVVETATENTNELAENHESATESVEDTENPTENKAETAKVEPLPEQKPFLLSPYERVILEEMERRATENPKLAEGLKDKDKSIQECYAFVANRAKKMADGNCAMIADNEVYNWAQFYYTQRREVIELEYERPKKPTYTPAPKPATTTAKTDNKKKTEKKPEKKSEPKAETKKPEQKSAETTEKVTGADGKVYSITNLALF